MLVSLRLLREPPLHQQLRALSLLQEVSAILLRRSLMISLSVVACVGQGISGALYVGGAAVLSSTLSVTGATTLSSTLLVSGSSAHIGVASFTSGIASTSTTTGSVIVTGGLLHLYFCTLFSIFLGEGISGALYVGGATVLSSTLAVTGATTLSATLSVAGSSAHAGVASFTSGTAATSTTTGAVVVTGGLMQ